MKHLIVAFWFFFVTFQDGHMHKLRFNYQADCTFYYNVMHHLHQIKVTECAEIVANREEEIS